MSKVSKGGVTQRAIWVVQGVCEGQVILRVHQKAQIRTENSPDNSLYLREKLNNTLSGIIGKVLTTHQQMLTERVKWFVFNRNGSYSSVLL